MFLFIRISKFLRNSFVKYSYNLFGLKLQNATKTYFMACRIQLFFERFLSETRNSIEIFRKIIESDKGIKQAYKVPLTHSQFFSCFFQ